MAYGFQAIQDGGTQFLINTDDSNEQLFQLRDSVDARGVIHTTYQASSRTATNAEFVGYNSGEITFLSSVEESIVLIRPKVRTATTFIDARIANGTSLSVRNCNTNTDIEFQVFDKVEDIPETTLDTGYGFNTYKINGNIHWSSNALSARVKGYIEGANASYSLINGWSTVMSQNHRVRKFLSGGSDGTGYYFENYSLVPRWNVSTNKIEIKSISTAIGSPSGSSAYDITYGVGNPTLLIADLGDL